MAYFVVNGDGTTTVVFDYTADTGKIQEVADDAAHWLWENENNIDPQTPWADLTNQDKLDLLDAEVKRHILEWQRHGYKQRKILLLSTI